MPAPAPVKNAAAVGFRIAAAASFAAPLLSRLALGYEFFLTGRGKLEHIDNFTKMLTDLGVPFPALNAAFVARVEYYGAILLILGLLTRFGALGLLSTMVVALLTADRVEFIQSLDPAAEKGPMDFASFVNLLLLLWLTLFGPGLVSLDALLARWLGLSPRAEPQTPQP
ncbi:MAG: DoxX family protein [Vicinamibacteria bacterium]